MNEMKDPFPGKIHGRFSVSLMNRLFKSDATKKLY
jgi:hypothetical protein